MRCCLVVIVIVHQCCHEHIRAFLLSPTSNLTWYRTLPSSRLIHSQKWETIILLPKKPVQDPDIVGICLFLSHGVTSYLVWIIKLLILIQELLCFLSPILLIQRTSNLWLTKKFVAHQRGYWVLKSYKAGSNLWSTVYQQWAFVHVNQPPELQFPHQ